MEDRKVGVSGATDLEGTASLLVPPSRNNSGVVVTLEELAAPVEPGRCGAPHPDDPELACTRWLGHPPRADRQHRCRTLGRDRKWVDEPRAHPSHQTPSCGAYGPMSQDRTYYARCTRDPDHKGRHANHRVDPADFGLSSAPHWTNAWIHDPDTDTTRPPPGAAGPTPTSSPTRSSATDAPVSHFLGLPVGRADGRPLKPTDDHPTWPGQDGEKGNGGGQVGDPGAPGAAPLPSIHQLAQLTRLEDVLKATGRDLCPSVPADELAELEHRAWWLAPPRHDHGADDLVHLCHHPGKHKDAYVQGEQGWRCRCHCGATTRKDPIGHVEPTATQETRLEDHADAR